MFKNHTEEAVRNQTRGMGCKIFEVGIRHEEKGMINKEYSLAQLLHSISYLKHMNAQGNDIYIKPSQEESALVLIDDLDPLYVEEMEETGIEPAVVIETSFKNFQCWIKLSDEPVEADIRKIIAKHLAQEFNGDPGSADAYHYGRLAGFTNRKLKHLTPSGFPFVKCRQSKGVIASRAEELLSMAKNEAEIHSKSNSEIFRNYHTRKQQKTAVDEFEAYFWDWTQKQGKKNADISQADFATVCHLLRCGYSSNEIERAMLEKSPQIFERKKHHVQDYVSRTIEKALTDIRKTNQRQNSNLSLSR